MGLHFVQRVSAVVVTVLLSTIAVFLLVQAVPGDIVAQMLGQVGDQPEAEAALRAFFGLDQPLYMRYLDWLGSLLQGDLGNSWRQGQPVASLVGSAFLVTFEVGLLTLVLATLVGVPLGFTSGMFENSPLDFLIQGFNVLALSAPVFWIAMMLLFGISAIFSWSPPFAYTPPTQSLTANLEHVWLPVLSLSFLQAATYSQFVRQAVIEEKGKEYAKTAVAKGMPNRTIYLKHIGRNILVPLITLMGLIFVQIIGGIVVIESLFALPGLGRLLLVSIQARDYPVVQAALLFVLFFTIFVNLLVDLLYVLIDPRMRGQ